MPVGWMVCEQAAVTLLQAGRRCGGGGGVQVAVQLQC